jgi:flagellar protein FlaG
MSTDIAVARPAAAVPASTGGSAKPQGKPEAENLEPAITREALADELARASARTGLTFRLDEVSHRTVVTVLDKDSGEVLRQIPGEVALRIARELARKGFGLIRDSA